MVCELKATPSGEIRYSVDGSSLDTAGSAYNEPFSVPRSSRVILARATSDGVTSTQLRVDVPSKPEEDRPVVDPQKPTVFKRRVTRDSTGETYQFLEMAARHLVNEADIAAVEGVQVRPESFIRRNNFWVGWEEVAKVEVAEPQVKARKAAKMAA